MYKYLTFFDLDRTLFDSESKINDEVADALDQIRKNGGLPVIATGRNLFELTDALKKSKITSVIAANGDYGMLNNKEIFSNTINPDLIDRVVKFADQYNESVTVFTQTSFGVNRYSEELEKGNAQVHAPIPPIVSPAFWHDNPINMMLASNINLDAEYIAEFGQELTFYRNSHYGIDVVCHDVSKATGIKQFIDTAGLQGIPTYAFGDGNNDIPMLDYVDHAVVMGNGLKNVKTHGEFITTDNTDHGIVNGLKHFDLI